MFALRPEVKQSLAPGKTADVPPVPGPTMSMPKSAGGRSRSSAQGSTARMSSGFGRVAGGAVVVVVVPLVGSGSVLVGVGPATGRPGSVGPQPASRNPRTSALAPNLRMGPHG